MQTNRNGMTILEVLMIVVILAILITIAVPMLIKSKIPANEISAVQSLRVLFLAEQQYYNLHKEYANLIELGNEKFITDVRLLNKKKEGYKFELWVDSIFLWHAEAVPERVGSTGNYAYYIDETNIIRYKENVSNFVNRSNAEKWRPYEP